MLICKVNKHIKNITRPTVFREKQFEYIQKYEYGCDNHHIIPRDKKKSKPNELLYSGNETISTGQ